MAKGTEWTNRIIGYDTVQADQLLANPANWRVHPKGQQDALTGVLNDIGWIAPVLVNQRTGFVVDGHLRVSLAISRGESVPVAYLDLSEAEEAEALATFDPLASMAVCDKEQLDSLLREVESGDAAVQAMLADLATKEGIIPSDFDMAADEEQEQSGQKEVTCPECGACFAPRRSRNV